MQGLVVNTSRGNLESCAIRSPGFGNSRVGMVDDLSMMLDTGVIDTDMLDKACLDDLGTCSKVIVTRSSTTFIDCPADMEKIEERKTQLRDTLREERLSEDESSVIKIRLARLAGGVGIIRVGGATEGELIERRDRVDDSLSATQAAIDEGVIPGGGVCLLSAISNIFLDNYSENERAGARVMIHACLSPIKQILNNAGESSDLIIAKIQDNKSASFGFNVADGEFCDMIKSGIIDPSKVARCAIENAVSAACTLLSAGCAMIVDNSE
jgi:chaperonin GroEL